MIAMLIIHVDVLLVAMRRGALDALYAACVDKFKKVKRNPLPFSTSGRATACSAQIT